MSAANRPEATDADSDPDDDNPGGRAVLVEPPLITRPFGRLLAMQAAFGFAFSVFLLLPKILAVTFASSAAEIGIVMAAFGVASILCIPLVGRVVDRLGNAGTLVFANLLMTAGALGFIFVHGAGAQAVLLRGLHGVAWSLAFTAGMAVAADLAPPSRLAQAVGLAGSASLIMNAVAPAIAEPLGDWLGHRAIFALAGCSALLGAWLARRLPPTAPHPVAAVGARPGAARAGRGSVFLVLGVSGLSFGALFTFIAPFALQHGIRAVSGFFATYTVAALAVRLLAARLVDRLGHGRVAAGAAVLYGLTVAAVGVLGPSPLLALGASFGAAHGALFPALMALLLADTPGPQRARVLGVANGAMNLGITSVLALGFVANRFGYPPVFVLAGVLTVATAILVGRRSQRGVGAVGGNGD